MCSGEVQREWGKKGCEKKGMFSIVVGWLGDTEVLCGMLLNDYYDLLDVLRARASCK